MVKETLLQKLSITIMFLAFIAFWVWVPDFFLTQEECKQQTPRAITSGLCSESEMKPNGFLESREPTRMGIGVHDYSVAQEEKPVPSRVSVYDQSCYRGR